MLTPQGLVLRGVFLWADNGPLLDLNAKNPKTKKPSTNVKGFKEGGDLLSHLVWQYHRRKRA